MTFWTTVYIHSLCPVSEWTVQSACEGPVKLLNLAKLLSRLMKAQLGDQPSLLKGERVQWTWWVEIGKSAWSLNSNWVSWGRKSALSDYVGVPNFHQNISRWSSGSIISIKYIGWFASGLVRRQYHLSEGLWPQNTALYLKNTNCSTFGRRLIALVMSLGSFLTVTSTAHNPLFQVEVWTPIWNSWLCYILHGKLWEKFFGLSAMSHDAWKSQKSSFGSDWKRGNGTIIFDSSGLTLLQCKISARQHSDAHSRWMVELANFSFYTGWNTSTIL